MEIFLTLKNLTTNTAVILFPAGSTFGRCSIHCNVFQETGSSAVLDFESHSWQPNVRSLLNLWVLVADSWDSTLLNHLCSEEPICNNNIAEFIFACRA